MNFIYSSLPGLLPHDVDPLVPHPRRADGQRRRAGLEAHRGPVRRPRVRQPGEEGERQILMNFIRIGVLRAFKCVLGKSTFEFGPNNFVWGKKIYIFFETGIVSFQKHT